MGQQDRPCLAILVLYTFVPPSLAAWSKFLHLPPESSVSFLLLVPAPLSSISFLSAASPLLFLFVAQAFAWNIFGCRLPVFDGIPFTSVPYWIVLRRGNENQGHFYRRMEVTLS